MQRTRLKAEAEHFGKDLRTSVARHKFLADERKEEMPSRHNSL
jgi:hypothetical protein